ASLAQLVHGTGNEGLATKAGVHGHQQDQVQLVHQVIHPVQRGGRVEHQAGLTAVVTDQRQGAIHVARGFGVETDVIGTGFGKFGNQCVHRLYHQVYVDRSGGVGAQRGTDHGAESQVRYKVVVHDVAVNPVAA